MRLAEFIRDNMEAILAEWEAFAATLLPAATGLTPLALRDHAQPILEAVAKDLATPQTREAQAEKSRGRAPRVVGAPETAAQTHAVLRARGGFDINQLIAEYRACIEELIASLDAGKLALAVEIARIPEEIRGYGHVKERHLHAARAKWAGLMAQWRGEPAAQRAAA